MGQALIQDQITLWNSFEFLDLIPLPTSHTTPSNSLASGQCQKFHLILTPSNQREHQIPHVKGSVTQDCPYPASKSKLLYLDQLAKNQRCPCLPPWAQLICQSCSQNSEQVYQLDFWFIIKGYNLGTARWKRYKQQGRQEREKSFHALSRHFFTNSEALHSPFCSFFFFFFLILFYF